MPPVGSACGELCGVFPTGPLLSTLTRHSTIHTLWMQMWLKSNLKVASDSANCAQFSRTRERQPDTITPGHAHGVGVWSAIQAPLRRHPLRIDRFDIDVAMEVTWTVSRAPLGCPGFGFC